MIFVFFRGYTAYEMQIGRLIMRFVHLRGGDWDKRPIWKRISFSVANKEESNG